MTNILHPLHVPRTELPYDIRLQPVLINSDIDLLDADRVDCFQEQPEMDLSLQLSVIWIGQFWRALQPQILQVLHHPTVSFSLAQAVVAYKSAHPLLEVGSSLAPRYLYTMQYNNWGYHFFRDEYSQAILALATHQSGMQGYISHDGAAIIASICERNRPGERVKFSSMLSMETLVTHIAKGQALCLMREQEYWFIEAILGEGFESVVLRIRHATTGNLLALKVGKIDLAGNYTALEPLLPSFEAAGIPVPRYLGYDPFINGILMDHRGGKSFEHCIAHTSDRPFLFRAYALCVQKLLLLDSLFHTAHGDAHDGNWLIDQTAITLLDFRYSDTLPFASTIYHTRDVFALLCTLYRLVTGNYPPYRTEVKKAIMEQRPFIPPEHEALPRFEQASFLDEHLARFLNDFLYAPHLCRLQDIFDLVERYTDSF